MARSRNEWQVSPNLLRNTRPSTDLWLYLGKQVVYHAVQGSSDEATPEILAALSQEIEQLQGQLSSAKEDEKKARASLAALEAKPRLSALRQDIQRLEEEKEEIQARLGTLRDSDTVQLSLEERSKLEEEWRQWQRHAAIRRRICLDLWARCTELLPENTSSSELWVSHILLPLKRIEPANGAARRLWDLNRRPNKRSGMMLHS